MENTSRHTLRKVNRQMDIQLVRSFSTTDSVLKKKEPQKFSKVDTCTSNLVLKFN